MKKLLCPASLFVVVSGTLFTIKGWALNYFLNEMDDMFLNIFTWKYSPLQRNLNLKHQRNEQEFSFYILIVLLKIFNQYVYVFYFRSLFKIKKV